MQRDIRRSWARVVCPARPPEGPAGAEKKQKVQVAEVCCLNLRLALRRASPHTQKNRDVATESCKLPIAGPPGLSNNINSCEDTENAILL